MSLFPKFRPIILIKHLYSKRLLHQQCSTEMRFFQDLWNDLHHVVDRDQRTVSCIFLLFCICYVTLDTEFCRTFQKYLFHKCFINQACAARKNILGLSEMTCSLKMANECIRPTSNQFLLLTSVSNIAM